MLQEEWREIKGYEGYYEVSSKGQVKSLTRVTVNTRGRKYRSKGKILSLNGISSSGYITVGLCKGDVNTHSIHKLVGAAFLEKDLTRSYINHIDGDRLNNKVSNLERCTQRENVQHSYDISGRKGTKGSAKLTEEQVLTIPVLLETMTKETVADLLCVKPDTIKGIMKGKRWADVLYPNAV